ncbi:hypothetical protein L6452_23931 [Arctium lappa]|uniref:Uncharacterized protein n=1 Tax=Arctium lappa TaxID=4217 RepID=A0ACB9A8I2_ARCLA|nr:hypothetical protein L6452_23931 [Arctium lappa]
MVLSSCPLSLSFSFSFFAEKEDKGYKILSCLMPFLFKNSNSRNRDLWIINCCPENKVLFGRYSFFFILCIIK